MKKKNLKTLKLTKRNIANFSLNQIMGGDPGKDNKKTHTDRTQPTGLDNDKDNDNTAGNTKSATGVGPITADCGPITAVTCN